MKGFCISPSYLALSVSLEQSRVLLSKDGNQENLNREKVEYNNQEFGQESSLVSINKTYEQEISKSSSKLEKRNLSESATYYQELLNRHPDLKVFDDERENSEYRENMKTMLADVKGMLRRKRDHRKYGFNNQTE